MKYAYLLSGAAIIVAFMVGCSKTTLGENIPDQSSVRLQTVLENMVDYNGKTVVMRGIVDGQCPSLCEFFFKDGAYRATIFPEGFRLPKLVKGKPVTVYARVTAGDEQVIFSALGLKLE